MSPRRGEALLLLLLALLIVAASSLAAEGQQRDEFEQLAGSTYSSGGRGARALFLWLEALGYPTERLQRPRFELRAEDGVLWLLAPSPMQEIDEQEAAEIEGWVARGGTLIFANTAPSAPLFEALDIPYALSAPDAALRPTFPWIRAEGASYQGYFHFPPRAGALPLLATAQGTVGAIRQRHGAGEVWLFATAEPFGNEALQAEANRALVEGLLAQLPRSDDDLRRDSSWFRGRGQPVPRSWARCAARPGAGRFFMARRLSPFGCCCGVAALVARFPSPASTCGARRGSTRAAWPGCTASRGSVRRSCATTTSASSAASPSAIACPPRSRTTPSSATSPACCPDLDQAALREHLRALQQPAPSERHLLALARANDEWLERLR